MNNCQALSTMPGHAKHSLPSVVNSVILGSGFPMPLHSQLPRILLSPALRPCFVPPAQIPAASTVLSLGQGYVWGATGLWGGLPQALPLALLTSPPPGGAEAYGKWAEPCFEAPLGQTHRAPGPSFDVA